MVSFSHLIWIKNKSTIDFLMVEGLRIHLPVQETQVGSLVWEDCTCHGATKCTSHNYWSPCTLEPVLRNNRSYCNGARALKLESSPCLLQLEKAHAKQWRLSTANIKKIIKKLKLCMLNTLWMGQHFHWGLLSNFKEKSFCIIKWLLK